MAKRAKVSELKTNTDCWMYALKYLPKLERLPAAMRGEIFKKLFELARIAKLTKRQKNAYYKSLHDMGIVKIKISNLENTVITQGNTIMAQGNTIIALQNNNAAQGNTIMALQNNNAALQKQVAAYQRKYGALEGAK